MQGSNFKPDNGRKSIARAQLTERPFVPNHATLSDRVPNQATFSRLLGAGREIMRNIRSNLGENVRGNVNILRAGRVAPLHLRQ